MASERTVHVPVMVREVLAQMEFEPGLTIVDGTVGAGGHSQQILKKMDPTSRLIGLDRDPAMLARAGQVLQDPRAVLVQSSYAELDKVLDELGIEQVDRVLLDLGLSSDQLADPERGFGFDTTGPLDMRFDTSTGVSAAELLETSESEQLQAIFTAYAEEPEARRIAEEIVAQRRRGASVTLASELKALVERIVGVAKGKSHPATRVFQALRIAVNRELDQLEVFLHDVLLRRLRANGRALVITFHSLEDRLVKQAFREADLWDTLTRKPMTAAPSEVRWNPRSRSAKLRVARRLAPRP
ncbi:16S rRNA (cytosine(1402)-N(4))-methyltransferase RsmH [Planctomicrobium piriforme]|uniref:Ribosomal RNA small subunit methyltransferase H n=1 Tax=Planctomicrobium piriforme TaxID=1576369 RepID=A0A1I3P743_9PLAN|nr:16S rRNA (cytosine(1402)-N(4))-methyltransferase RsmH [Planctomicrobium piriforme]SFJ17211.1 16S rRNA (cytosine1402-N4)-methyltransferase [Planctomicrobium piriforme]